MARISKPCSPGFGRETMIRLGGRAAEIHHRFGNDLAAEGCKARLRVAEQLVVHDGTQHPVAHVPRGIAQAVLQGDGPGDGSLGREEPGRIARSKSRDRLLELRVAPDGELLCRKARAASAVVPAKRFGAAAEGYTRPGARQARAMRAQHGDRVIDPALRLNEIGDRERRGGEGQRGGESGGLPRPRSRTACRCGERDQPRAANGPTSCRRVAAPSMP